MDGLVYRWVHHLLALLGRGEVAGGRTELEKGGYCGHFCILSLTFPLHCSLLPVCGDLRELLASPQALCPGLLLSH